MLLEKFLNPMGLTQRDLADGIRVPYQRINEIVNGRRGITPTTALRLAKFFSNSEGFWMNLQLRWDLYQASRSEERELGEIRPLSVQSTLDRGATGQQRIPDSPTDGPQIQTITPPFQKGHLGGLPPWVQPQIRFCN